MCNNRRNYGCGCGCENNMAEVLEAIRCDALAAAASIEQTEKEIKKIIKAVSEVIEAEQQENCGCGCGYGNANGNGCMVSYRDFCNNNWCSCCSC